MSYRPLLRCPCVSVPAGASARSPQDVLDGKHFLPPVQRPVRSKEAYDKTHHQSAMNNPFNWTRSPNRQFNSFGLIIADVRGFRAEISLNSPPVFRCQGFGISEILGDLRWDSRPYQGVRARASRFTYSSVRLPFSTRLSFETKDSLTITMRCEDSRDPREHSIVAKTYLSLPKRSKKAIFKPPRFNVGIVD